MAQRSSISFGGGGRVTLTAKQAHMRAREEERIQRLLESKSRILGVDRQALDDAVALKRAIAEEEAAREAAVAAAQAAAAAEADAAEMEVMERARDERDELRAVWRSQLDRSQRAEWDLSDPRSLAREQPPRSGDTIAPGVGPSAGQVFDGEKLEDPRIDEEARRDLIEANNALLARNRELEAHERELERAAADAALAAAAEADAREAEQRMQEREERRRYDLENKTLSRAEAMGRRALAERESAEAKAELESTLADPMLAEVHGIAAGVGGRVRPDHYKGMSKEQLEAVRAVQAAQARVVKEQREADAARERAVAEAAAAAAKEAEEAELSERQRRRQEQRQYFLDIKAQQRADRLRRQMEEQERKERFDETADGILSRFGTSLK